MSTAQTDAHHATNQSIVENFYELMMDDIVGAENALEEMENGSVKDACYNLLQQEYKDNPERGREDYLTDKNKHV